MECIRLSDVFAVVDFIQVVKVVDADWLTPEEFGQEADDGPFDLAGIWFP